MTSRAMDPESAIAGPGRRRAALLTAALCVAGFLLTRQTQIDALNGTAAPWAVLMVLAFMRPGTPLVWVVPMLAYGAVSSVASIFGGNEAANGLRFFVIAAGTLLAFSVRPARIGVGVALSPLILQCLVIIGVSVWLGYSRDDELGQLVRGFILETTWGDIYSFDGIYYRVQLIGNALVPLLFLIALWRYRRSRFDRWVTWLSLLGVIAAGNLTYAIVAAIGIALRLWGRIRKSVVFWVLLPFVLAAGLWASWDDIQAIVDRKFEGQDSSMGVRFDQVDVAVESWKESPGKFLVGAGLGAPYPDGRERDYSQFQYIELQLLYLIYQLGALGILVYACSLVALSRLTLDPDGRTIFWLYVLSGSTNPTILDSNQIVATVLLICLFPRSRAEAGRRAIALTPRAVPASA